MAEDSREDHELAQRAAEGDKEAYRRLVEKYQARAFAIALEILKVREDAQDVVQEAFVKAFLSLREFRGQSSFYTWLYRIVYNMAIDYKRKLVRRGSETTDFDELRQGQEGSDKPSSSLSPTPHDVLFRKQQAERIQKVLGDLSDEHRAVILLREIEGMNYEQIAQTIGISKGTVMSRLHYARKKLQEGLKDLAPASSIRGEREEQREHDMRPARGRMRMKRLGSK